MKAKEGEHPFGDTGQLILFCLFLIVWVGDSFFLHLSTFLSHIVPLYVRLILLALVLILAAYLVKSGHAVIDHDGSSTGVVSTGAFHYVRHPVYLGSMLFYLGLSISTASLISFGLFIVIFVFYDYLATYEEKLLDERFGEEYRNYRNRTGKWVPRFPARR